MKFNKAGIGVAVVLMMVSMVNITLNIHRLRQEYRTRDWPSTPGYLVEKKIDQIEFGKWQYHPYVKYDYAVKPENAPPGFKKRYTNDVIYPSEFDGSKMVDPVRDILNQFEYGSVFNVYYNPDDPSESVLMPSIRRSTLIRLAVSILPFIAAMVVLRFSRKKQTPAQSADFGPEL